MFLLTVQLILRECPMTMITLQFLLLLRVARCVIVIFIYVIIIILYLFLYLFVMIAAIVYPAIIKFCTPSCCRHRFEHPYTRPFLWTIGLVLYLGTVYYRYYNFIIYIWFKLSFSATSVYFRVSALI